MSGAVRNLFDRLVDKLKDAGLEKTKDLSMPRFWQHKSVFSGILPELLLPVAVIYYLFSQYRTRRVKPEKLSVPVVCIGNVTLGGAGKTPTAMKVGRIFIEKGKRIAFISRGYKGALEGPAKVDKEKHTYKDVGDEPLLLAEIGPTYIGKDKLETAKLAIAEGAEVLILDDGLQNNQIQKDVCITVIDGGFGFGNYFTFPAGPLREPVPAAIKKSNISVIIGKDIFNVESDLRRYTGNITKAKYKLSGAEEFKEKTILAFAGIARPQKFFDSLSDAGFKSIIGKGYADHYDYNDEDIAELIEDAKDMEAQLITTEKDAARLPEYFKKYVGIVKAEMEFDDLKRIELLLRPLL